jgi:molecular chaperone DnaK
MAGNLFEFYQKKGWTYLEAALQRIAGRSSEYVVEEALYRKYVIDAGWNALPDYQRRVGRERLQWDEILAALRRESFNIESGKLVFRPDCRARMSAVLSRVLIAKTGRPAEAPAAARAAPPASAVDAESDSDSGDMVFGQAPSAPAHATPPRAAVPTHQAPVATAIGIDFGTTYSGVAHVDATGKPVSIPNKTGDNLTPSVVLFETEGVTVGNEAVAAAAQNPDKIADAVKRDLGAKTYHRALHGWDLPPEAIAAFILKSLKADAERKLGPVTKAVITVPAYFDEKRRQATLTSCQLADLELLEILNEPIAAALAWAYQKSILGGALERPVQVVVYDLGGGTFDVTVVAITGNAFKMLATDGDVYLGGKDWDEALADIAADRIAREIGQDPRANPITQHGLLRSAEAAKRLLTDHQRAAIAVHLGGRKHKVEVTRQEFENATAPLLARTRTLTESVVLQAGLDWPNIDKVLLVGGAARMPMVGRLLEELTGEPPDRSISPEEAVAHGAALYADLLARRQAGGVPDRFSVNNVNAHSLGIVGVDSKTGRRRNQILIPRNTPLPCTVTTTLKTSRPNQRRLTIRVVQGESEDLAQCTPLGFYTISNLPPNLPLGWPVHLSYIYEANGELRVQAKVEGHAAVVTAKFERDSDLPKEAMKRWNKLVKREWKKNKQG